MRADWFPSPIGNGVEEQQDVLIADHHVPKTATSRFRGVKVLLTGLLVWWGPLLVVGLLRGGDDTLTEEAVFFSQAAMLTFGGAYAVLSYINQAAVEVFGWLDDEYDKIPVEREILGDVGLPGTIPPNDGGLAAGQLAIGIHFLEKRRS